MKKLVRKTNCFDYAMYGESFSDGGYVHSWNLLSVWFGQDPTYNLFHKSYIWCYVLTSPFYLLSDFLLAVKYSEKENANFSIWNEQLKTKNEVKCYWKIKKSIRWKIVHKIKSHSFTNFKFFLNVGFTLQGYLNFSKKMLKIQTGITRYCRDS